MLQNRVDPLGNLIKTKARGAWTGTRGLIHNDQQEIVRPFKLKAWITCRLEFKGRKRKMMSPGLYTELFFWDEATAFAAGHRPCCECRRADFDAFKMAWIAGNPQYGFTKKTSIREIDEVIHRQRINADQSKPTFEANLQDLPAGTFILHDDKPYLFTAGKLLLWTPFGYTEETTVPVLNKVVVLTPASVVNAFSAGYVPGIILPA